VAATPITLPADTPAADQNKLNRFLRVSLFIDPFWVAPPGGDLELYDIHSVINDQGASLLELVAYQMFGDRDAGEYYRGDLFFLVYDQDANTATVQRLLDLSESDELIVRLREWVVLASDAATDDVLLSLFDYANERLAAGLESDPTAAFQAAVSNFERLAHIPLRKLLSEMFSGLRENEDDTWEMIREYIEPDLRDRLARLAFVRDAGLTAIRDAVTELYGSYRRALDAHEADEPLGNA
jgi:hypothetical protein